MLCPQPSNANTTHFRYLYISNDNILIIIDLIDDFEYEEPLEFSPQSKMKKNYLYVCLSGSENPVSNARCSEGKADWRTCT